ncbi:MAG TPA: SDR family oxidoreductase [Telluria sp.]|jgi:NAD(P)-dependent dehydrogenase (short-subunit alcohol dehydrogenase family)
MEFANYPSLAGKAVFVTGGGSGIGADIVAAFARQGARVAFADRDIASSTELVDGLAGTVAHTPYFIGCDLSDIDALRASVKAAGEKLGDFDVLVNNAASDERHDFLDVTPAYFDAKLAINLKVAFFAAQAVVEGMQRRGGGAIINLGSTGWKNKVAGYPVYATAKSAVNGLTRSLARELGKSGIRVNTLTPGWVMTPRQLDKWVDPAAERAMDENQCLPGRIVGADVASMALFLGAHDSRMMTAQEFVVDAGWT